MSLINDLFGKKQVKEVSSTIENIGESASNVVSGVNFLEGMTVKEKNDLSDKVSSISEILTLITIFVVPLLFAPILADSFDLPKQTLLFFASLIGLILLGVKGVLKKRLALTLSPLHLPIGAFLLVTLISAFMSDNRYAALSAETVLVAGCVFLFVLVSSLPSKESFIVKSLNTLLGAGAILSVWTLVQVVYTFVAPTANLPTLFLFSPTFNPSGSALSQGLFLLVLLPIAIGLYQEAKKNKSGLSLVFLATNVLGLLLTGYILYQNRPILMDYTTGWKVAAGSLGQTLTAALVGTGPGHFIDAFTAFKPTSFNTSPLWNLRFSTSANYLFYLLTTVGIAGLASFLLVIFRFSQMARSRLQVDNVTSLEKALIAAISFSLILMVFLPAPLTSIFLLFTLIGLLLCHYRFRGLSLFAKQIEVSTSHYRYGILAALIVLLALSALNPLPNAFSLTKALAADYFFAQSLQAAAANNGQATYDSQIQALNLNPWNSGYRVAYSQTNLALANSLAGQPNLSDAQKQIVVQLVQQSLREARIAASLQPRRAANWENLSLVYRNLINFAQGADQWSVATANQAITFDPTNPRIRLDLGGILYASGDYQNAAQIFNQAANLKPDFANAHYNLAQALKQLKISEQALQQLQLTATLVCAAPATPPPGGPNNGDCQKVNSEIDSLTKEIESAAKEANQTPVASPSAEVKPTGPQTPLASPTASPKTNLPKARTQPPAQVSSQSGEIKP